MKFNKKQLIISITAVIVVAIIACTALLTLSKNNSDTSTSDVSTPKPGDAVELSKTPTYNTCQLLDKSTIASILGKDAESLSESKRSGSIARNMEVSDNCSYDYDNATVTIQVYSYGTSSDSDEGAESYNDGTWLNITRQTSTAVAYELEYPSYFQAIDKGDKRVYTFIIATPTKNILFSIEQTKDAASNDDTAQGTLIKLANSAKLEVTSDPDAPPAPVVD